MINFTEEQYKANGGKMPWLPTGQATLTLLWRQLVSRSAGCLSIDSVPSFDPALLTYALDLQNRQSQGITSESFEGYSYSMGEQRNASIDTVLDALLVSMGCNPSATTDAMVIGSLDRPSGHCPRCRRG